MCDIYKPTLENRIVSYVNINFHIVKYETVLFYNMVSPAFVPTRFCILREKCLIVGNQELKIF